VSIQRLEMQKKRSHRVFDYRIKYKGGIERIAFWENRGSGMQYPRGFFLFKTDTFITIANDRWIFIEKETGNSVQCEYHDVVKISAGTKFRFCWSGYTEILMWH